MSGRFFVLEGGEGVGKSTQSERLARRLGAVLTREPGGTALGAGVRRLFLDPSTGAVDPRAEALLMAADRAQHVSEVVRPALARGRTVVSDRYLYSSVAYQAYARGLDPAEVTDLSLWGTGGLLPDLVVLLDLPVDQARERLADRTPDRLEAEDAAFHERVRAGFRVQADGDPARWLVLDASVSADVLTEVIAEAVLTRFPELDTGDGPSLPPRR